MRLEPFNYTGKTVVGVKRFNEAVEAEMRRVLPLKGQWRGEGYGYPERYGDGYMNHVIAKLNGPGGLICVTAVSALATEHGPDPEQRCSARMFHPRLSLQIKHQTGHASP